MADKDSDKKKNDTKTSNPKTSNPKSGGTSSNSTKKKRIPNSGTNVFLKETSEKSSTKKTEKSSKDNYWKQGDLFEVGKSIKDLSGKTEVKKPVKKKTTVNKKNIPPKKTVKQKDAIKTPTKDAKLKSTTKPKSSVNKNTTAAHKKSSNKTTKLKDGTSNHSNIKEKTTPIKKVSNSKKIPRTNESDSKVKKPTVTKTVNTKKSTLPKSENKVESKNIKVDDKNIHSKKSHSIFIFLISLSVVLIFIILFILNIYFDKKNNDELLIKSPTKIEDLQLADNSYEINEEIATPKIIKPTVIDKENNSSYEIVIEKGMSAKVIASLIGKSGYFDEDIVLQYFIDNDISQKINIGKYYLIPSMSLEDLSDKITIKDHFTMVIYPGMRLSQIDSILSKRNLCEEGEFIEECTALCDEYGLSFVEGWFAPGNYYINNNLDVKELCINMYYSMLNELSPFLDDISKSNFSIEQILIIASLIQAETNDVKQMPLISEVIHNRLKADMPLGINATTCYELGVYTSDIDQSVYDKITDYNTRRKKGLVPSAISAVSADALDAAIHPSVGEYLYYNHTKDGNMLMAKTYEQHLINVEGNK